MRDQSTNTNTETYEHIPWSRLTLTKEVTERSRWMYVAAALLALAAVAAVVTRMLWHPGGAAAVTSTTIATSHPVLETSPSLPPPSLYTEADLMATVPPLDVDRMVASGAEQYIRRWGTTAAEDGWSYVEWAAVESVEDLGDGLFRVTVLFQLIEGGDGETVRLPVEAANVTIEVAGDDMTIVDLPVPAEVDSPTLADHQAAPSEAPAAMTAAARDVVGVWGPSDVVEAGLVGQNWRVVLEVSSVHGPGRTVAVWFTQDGEQTHPRG